MSSKEESGAKIAAGCLFTLVMIVPSALWRAYCLIAIYDWHVRPVFGGPHWTLKQAWAFSLFIVMLTHQTPPDVEEKERTLWDSIFRSLLLSFFVPGLSMFIAWCLK